MICTCMSQALSSSSDGVLTVLFPQSELASQKRPPTVTPTPNHTHDY